ncbi:MAG: Protein of unknown function (DUF1501) [uncultured Pyrinomonadaceae bacterium]|uniref:DUF1501 domain-containing protein n=1 Tax=uncultured Pyrinomonadaceae bacterium TaxID=2283094 RepID=A0A6J4NDB0_9BACT|nr:MAG: Protein of unknown function (DUF1501) [uncultured Pyrinomonadaceae bacterium]
MKKSRREFLKTSCRALSMAAVATQMRHFGLINVLAQENAASEPALEYKALVCVFLSGGNDSNNNVVPNYDAGYAQYAAARQTQGLAIPRANLLPITPPILGQDYGFHPSMTDMRTLWTQGKLAVVTNVGTLVQPITRQQYQSGAPRPMQLFSHSDQVEQFRTAISNYRATTGWGGRVSDRTNGLNAGAAIPMITSIAGATVFNIGNNTAPLIVAPSPTPLNQVLALNGFGTASDELARRTAMNNIRQVDLNYTMIQNASVLTQQAINVSQQLITDPVLTVTFPNTTLGNQLRQVAKLMKFRTQLNMSRQIFYVQLGGFDTHSAQLTNHANLWTQVSQALKAFYDETVAQGIGSQVTTFTMSDFNRTFNPAGSGSGVGSDHAWAGHHFVIGGAVRGGDFYGKPTSNGTIFPTLVNGGPDDAETRGRFIPSVSVDMYTSTLARWYGLSENDIPLVFPNINNFPASNLGFMM